MPKFLFDCGNTCIKFALFTEEVGLSHYQFIDYSDVHNFVRKLFNLYPIPDEIKIASVTKSERLERLLSNISEFSDVKPTIAISQKSALGLTNQYDLPESLGVDRWLGMLAAWDIYREPMLVVDLGTALTIDYISKEGDFKGGLILPGIKSLRDALLKDTAIQNVSELTYTSKLGHNTNLCISSGIHYAIAGSIVALYQSLPDVDRVILAGGRAKWLKDILEPMLPQTNYHVHKHLVLEGLLRFKN